MTERGKGERPIQHRIDIVYQPRPLYYLDPPQAVDPPDHNRPRRHNDDPVEPEWTQWTKGEGSSLHRPRCVEVTED